MLCYEGRKRIEKRTDEKVGIFRAWCVAIWNKGRRSSVSIPPPMEIGHVRILKINSKSTEVTAIEN